VTVPQALVTRFFQLVDKRQFAEAERELQRIKNKMQENEWNRGYYTALFGILLSTKTNNDQYLFLPKLDRNDKKALREHRREFLGQVNNRLNGDYDRGFFSAWADYTRIILKTIPKTNMKNRAEKTRKPAKKEERKEVLNVPSPRKGEAQTNIFQFLSRWTQQSVEENPKDKP